MNGYSDVIKDLHVRYYCNYLQQTPPTNYQRGDYWLRLSKQKCLSGGQQWSELSAGPAPPSAGYEPIHLPQYLWKSNVIAPPAGPGCLTIHFGSVDAVFPTALDNWETIQQVGIWGHETSTDPNYFFGGFEISPGLNLTAGERLSFKNNGVADTEKAIRINHTSSGGAETASGVNTYAETSGTTSGFTHTWIELLNDGASTYPTLRTDSTYIPMARIKMALSNSLWVSWVEPDPAISGSYIQNWVYSQDMDTTNFSLTDYNLPDPGGHRLLFRNEKVIVYSPATEIRYVNTIGLSMTDSSSGNTRGWGGGLVDNAPVTVLTGETPIIEIHGFSSTFITQGQTP